MRRIGVVTTSRADYGLLRPVIRALKADPDLDPVLYVSGLHLAARHGETVREIEADGLPIAARIPCLGDDDDSRSVAEAMGRATAGMASALDDSPPDLLLVLGDRFEMFACAVAAVPFNLPVAHIHGGETTFGATDEVFRHGLTKIAHLHFPAAESFARRLRQMGEEPWRITVSGSPAIDNFFSETNLSAAEIQARYGIGTESAPLLVTLHPETRSDLAPETQAAALVEALESLDLPVVITGVNADVGNRAVSQALSALAERREDIVSVDHLGSANYVGLMRRAAAMVGNSSSGLIEAPSAGLPVVNIGDRQRGRPRAGNVIDVPFDAQTIAAAVRRAVSPEFRAGFAGLVNPYGDGRAAERIAARLREVPIDRRLLVKEFVDQ